MIKSACVFLTAAILFAGSWSAQSSSTTTPQDVPKAQAPGTNNPDISKQRRPAPDPPRTDNPEQNRADVPHQEPGTNSPDLGKQRSADKAGPVDSKARDTNAKIAKKKPKTKKK